MGVFDFVKNAGAKIGIGKSTDEEAAEAAAEAASKAKEAAMQRGIEKQAEMADKAAADRAKAKASAAADAVKDKAQAAMKKAKLKSAANERFAEYKKSNELEKYVTDLGINMDGIDIRFDDGTAYIEGEAVDQATKEKIILSVGNAHGVGKVDEEITVAVQEDPAVFHTVASGDTLWAVAEKVYGDGNRYPEIFEANKPMLTDPDLIFPGQVLRCPK